jgi:hypothetical protein
MRILLLLLLVVLLSSSLYATIFEVQNRLYANTLVIAGPSVFPILQVKQKSSAGCFNCWWMVIVATCDPLQYN